MLLHTGSKPLAIRHKYKSYQREMTKKRQAEKMSDNRYNDNKCLKYLKNRVQMLTLTLSLYSCAYSLFSLIFQVS